MSAGLPRRLAAEMLGAAWLLAAVVGSGIMAERLADGNIAIALLANSLATAGALFVLIEIFGPLSGAHFNPAVTLVQTVRGRMRPSESIPYAVAQCAGACAGVWIAHLMFDLPMLQVSQHVRDGGGQWLGEFVATFGLIGVIAGVSRFRPAAVGAAVACYIGAGYWFTSSTSFANPAAVLGRILTDSFAGIAPASALPFIAAQISGALAGMAAFDWMFGPAKAQPASRTDFVRVHPE